MKVCIINHNNFESKLIEALNNAKDRHDSGITFFVQEHSLKYIEAFMVRRKVDSFKFENKVIYMFKDIKVVFEIVDYYVY